MPFRVVVPKLDWYRRSNVVPGAEPALAPIAIAFPGRGSKAVMLMTPPAPPPLVSNRIVDAAALPIQRRDRARLAIAVNFLITLSAFSCSSFHSLRGRPATPPHFPSTFYRSARSGPSDKSELLQQLTVHTKASQCQKCKGHRLS